MTGRTAPTDGRSHWTEVERLFFEALEQDTAARTRWLDAQVADAVLRGEVQSMLAAHERVTGILEHPPAVPDDGSRAQLTRALGDRYTVGDVLGRGGSATVYLALEHKHERPVVLKVLHPEVAMQVGAQRFLGEVRIAAQLAHPHILPLIDSGEVDGLLYYVMPHLGGETLRTRLARRGALPPSEAVALLRDIAEALGAVHAAGIVHRDLKPENVLCAGDHAYLLDFGIAVKKGAWDTRHTHEGVVVGTVGYMSPEQAAGRFVDPSSDVFTWGVMAREMLSGRGPLDGHTTLDDPSLPAALVGLVRQALDSDPSRRPATAGELVERLNALSVTPAATPAVPRPRRRARPRNVAVILLIALGALGVWQWQRAAGGEAGLRSPVAIAPLRNETGDTSLAIWGRMASDWLTQGLHESALVHVVPWPTVRLASEQLAASDPAREAPPDALAREVGAGTLVTGSYYLSGGRLRFRLDVTDAARRELIGSLPSIEAPQDSAEQAIRELRERLMGLFAVQLDERASSLPGLTTRPPTFRAYQSFDRGLALYNQQNYGAAAAEFRQAWSVDTSFPVPLIYAAMAHWNQGDFPWVDTLVTTAQRMRSRLSTYDQLQVDYLAARLASDGNRAIAAGTRATEIAPESRAAYNLGRDLIAMDRALEGRRILEAIDPDRGLMKGWPSYWTQLTHACHLTADHGAELAAARAMRQRFPDARVAWVLEARALAAARRTTALDSLLAVTAALPAATYWSHGAALVTAGEELTVHHDSTLGRRYLDDGIAWLQQQLRTDAGRREHRYWLGSAFYDEARWLDADTLFAALHREFPDRHVYQGLAALTRAHRGYTRDAVTILGPAPSYARGDHTMYRARLAAITGDTAAARTLYRQSLDEVSDGFAWLHAGAFRDLRYLPPARQTP
jgi:tRNA A-37 threonylcarbamoyl transferase component Bud32/tetratricopeptide (TPR) repeat protein